MEDYILEEAELDVSAARDRIESVLVMRKELEARWQEAVKMQAIYYDKSGCLKTTPLDSKSGYQPTISKLSSQIKS